MAEKFLKVIQDGVASYVPDNKSTRDFWAKQNARLGKNRSSAHELVTILPATDEEVAFMTKPVADSAAAATQNQNSAVEKLESLRAVLDSQQALINQLLLKNETKPVNPPVQVEEAEDKAKGKPGPKPKTNNDGKDEKTSGEA